jgi:Kef-type K+ transport system membrane component KefB
MSLTPDTTTNFLVDLFVLFAGSVLAGEVAVRLGQAALVGQLLVGVVLGPTLMGPYLGLTSLTPELSAIQFLATVFILFMAGLEVVPEDIARMGLPTRCWASRSSSSPSSSAGSPRTSSSPGRGRSPTSSWP